MSKQPEAILEDQLVALLQKLGYSLVPIATEAELLANFKKQLEKHNGISLSATEFEKVMNIVSKGSVFEKAHTLREKQHIVRDNGNNLYFEFLNIHHWCRNQYQVTRQVTIEGVYTNRYDVTLLVNGLPLVQIELKRRGLELKEAFYQTNRYQRHSYQANSALFQYIQIFVISNGVNTKYYANNRDQSFKQTFFWADIANKRITNILNGFTETFLEPCFVSKMICRYMVLNETFKILMVLRPYQYYAVEALTERVLNSNKNGYIWHTTGSGKTLTAFKAAQVLMQQPEIKKVVFVVDRKDLDYQTIKEFDSFQPGSVDATDNTQSLVNQFLDVYKDKKGIPKNSKLIVTTIQKLNTAISKPGFQYKMGKLQEEKIVFIFDECHRSQFGETHRRINTFFKNTQLFGFTGTPIFAKNSMRNELGKRTTKELFHDCLHKYVITDAIKDENVLKFSVEYVGRYKRKDGTENEVDIEVEAIDTKELMEAPQRLEKITDYILAHHNRKTHNREYSAIFCVNSVETLIKYYEIFKRKKEAGEHELNIVTIFSYTSNEADADAMGFLPEELSVVEEAAVLYGLNRHTRDKLEAFIGDYNQMYGTPFSTKTSQAFENYYKDISKKLKDRERRPENLANRIDILLVVNMFLTGFDAKMVNTLYVDKNLNYHGLVQAYSRTNRVLNEQKSQGNIVAFRNLKPATDEAITLFSNKEAIEEIILKPYPDYVGRFNEGVSRLLEIAPTVNSVNELETETDELAFVQAFRELVRLKNVLNSFADFNWEHLAITEQQFEDYKSKYLDLHDKVKSGRQKEQISILNDVDFELELIHRDEINVAYIIRLLVKLKAGSKKDVSKTEKEIYNLLNSEVQLRSKRELIEEFIQEHLPQITDAEEVAPAFEQFWNGAQQKAFAQLVAEEQLDAAKTEALLEQYLYAERLPLRDEVLALHTGPAPTLLQRKPLGERILNKIVGFVRTFLEGMEG